MINLTLIYLRENLIFIWHITNLSFTISVNIYSELKIYLIKRNTIAPDNKQIIINLK